MLILGQLFLGHFLRIIFTMFRRLVSSTPMVKVFINDIPVQVAQGSSVIQACEAAGVDIPRFCYHEKLSVAGNCRMCLVELEKSPKPIASCAWPVMPDMKVKTDTPLVKKAREGVMEFLLANHPLDCPICDQGGECDLQDQSVRYGSDRSRFTEEKRATANKNLGPLVKTVMTRCIHCTRCVRFANQVAGSVDLGTSGRGNDMEIGTYVEKTLSSEMSGNIIDLCPVGALTSKPYAFTARPWELKKTPSIDVLDAVGSNIRVDSRGQKVMRILPRRNDDINDEWISDKTRFSYDGLTNQRLTSPMINRNGSFEPCTWQEALEYISSNLKTVSANEIGGIAGQLADAESLLALLDFVHMQNSENLMLDTNHSTPSGLVSFSSNFILNSTINGIDEADCILLVGTNPRHDAAIINTRIRKSYLDNNLEVGLIGKLPNLNYQVDHIGESPSDIESLCNGKHPFAKKLMNAKRPLILVSSNVLESKNCLSKIARLIKKLPASANEDWAIFNLLQKVVKLKSVCIKYCCI
jgi:NADH dehydrogenase (ubiquinone) Fe-S protein 1